MRDYSNISRTTNFSWTIPGDWEVVPGEMVGFEEGRDFSGDSNPLGKAAIYHPDLVICSGIVFILTVLPIPLQLLTKIPKGKSSKEKFPQPPPRHHCLFSQCTLILLFQTGTHSHKNF